MPELPEVERVCRSLDTLIRGRRIALAELLRPLLSPGISAEEFSASLSGCTVNFVHRRGKHVLVDLEPEKTLIVHLRMSGRFSLRDSSLADPKFTHAVFHFDDETRLVFDDQRHFGAMKIVPTAQLSAAKELCKLAPEPFSAEFTPQYLLSSAKACGKSLKEFLLDQTKVCGLGNIYASEAMFLAGLNPRRAANTLTRPKANALHGAIISVLTEATNFSETAEIDPTDIDKGYFNGSSSRGWLVYDREGEPCVSCGETIVRVKQGGRSTYFCRKCQRR